MNDVVSLDMKKMSEDGIPTVCPMPAWAPAGHVVMSAYDLHYSGTSSH